MWSYRGWLHRLQTILFFLWFSPWVPLRPQLSPESYTGGRQAPCNGPAKLSRLSFFFLAIIAQKCPNQLKSECWEMRGEVACWSKKNPSDVERASKAKGNCGLWLPKYLSHWSQRNWPPELPTDEEPQKAGCHSPAFFSAVIQKGCADTGPEKWLFFESLAMGNSRTSTGFPRSPNAPPAISSQGMCSST